MKRDEGGFVLIVVVWILAVLTIIAMSYAKAAMLDRRAAAQMLTQVQAQYLARGAIERGLVELRNRELLDRIFSDNAGVIPARNWYFFTHDLTSEVQTFAILRSPDYDKEKDILQYTLYDEEGLINVNTAPAELLDNIPGLSPGVVRAINFRRGTLEGQEKTEKQPFLCLEEIRNLEGVKDKDWFGDAYTPGLRNILTVWGAGKINVNSAPVEVLKCIPKLDPHVLTQILRYRAGLDRQLGTEDDLIFQSIQEMADKLNIKSDLLKPIEDYCMFTSRFFKITAIATLRAGNVTSSVTAVVSSTKMGAHIHEWREGPLGS